MNDLNFYFFFLRYFLGAFIITLGFIFIYKAFSIRDFPVLFALNFVGSFFVHWLFIFILSQNTLPTWLYYTIPWVLSIMLSFLALYLKTHLESD